MRYHQMQKLVKEVKLSIKKANEENDYFRRDYLINIKHKLRLKLRDFAKANNYKNNFKLLLFTVVAMDMDSRLGIT